MQKVYRGYRCPGPNVVEVVEADGRVRKLDPRYDLRNHSPDGFEWGYTGSGPSQLALAICADFLQDDAMAQAVYHTFKERVIAGLFNDRFELSEEFLQGCLTNLVDEMIKGGEL